MPWVRVDDAFAEHPKVIQAGPLGIALQVAGLCYANRHLTDGFIPRAAAVTLLDFGGLALVSPVNSIGVGSGEDVQPEHVIAALVELGIWETAPGGYRIHDYEDYQDSKATILENRAKTKNRVAKWRSHRSNGDRNGVTNGVSNGVGNAAPTPTPTEEQEPSVEQARRRAEAEQVFETWKAATGKVKARLDEKRARRIRWALDNFPLEDVVDAVQGWRHSAHHRGENERNTKYNDLELLLRDATHLERFRDLQRDSQPPPTQSERERQLAVTQAKLANSPWAKKYGGGQPA